jgi:hypothetical protein
VPGLVLAGAWTDTGWPATLEGAVLSGHAAAEEALGAPRDEADGWPALATVTGGAGPAAAGRDE